MRDLFSRKAPWDAKDPRVMMGGASFMNHRPAARIPALASIAAVSPHRVRLEQGAFDTVLEAASEADAPV